MQIYLCECVSFALYMCVSAYMCMYVNMCMYIYTSIYIYIYIYIYIHCAHRDTLVFPKPAFRGEIDFLANRRRTKGDVSEPGAVGSGNGGVATGAAGQLQRPRRVRTGLGAQARPSAPRGRGRSRSSRWLPAPPRAANTKGGVRSGVRGRNGVSISASFDPHDESSEPLSSIWHRIDDDNVPSSHPSAFSCRARRA